MDNPKMYPAVLIKYDAADMRRCGYRFSNADEVKKILGFDFRTMRGFKDLSVEKKALAENLICKFINGFGLEYRETAKCRPFMIIDEPKKRQFKVVFKEKNYSYLRYDGGIR